MQNYRFNSWNTKNSTTGTPFLLISQSQLLDNNKSYWSQSSKVPGCVQAFKKSLQMECNWYNLFLRCLMWRKKFTLLISGPRTQNRTHGLPRVHWIYVSSGLRRVFLTSSFTFSLVSANHFIPLTYEIVSTGMMRQKLCNYIIPVHPMTQIAWSDVFLWNLQGTTGVFKASIWSLKDTSVRVPQLF